MGAKRYYRCPDCDHVLDREKYPAEGACPHCIKAARAWGRAKARREIRPGEELILKPDGPHALDMSQYRFSHYLHTLGIAILIPAIFFLAMPRLFSAQTEPVFAKVRYLAGYQEELEVAAARAEEEAAGDAASRQVQEQTTEEETASAAEAVPERLSEVMRDSSTKRQIYQLLSLLAHGKDFTRLIGLLSGVIAGVALAGLYLHSVRRRRASIRTNSAGFLVILALLTVNLSAVRYARAEAIGIYEVSTSSVNDMVGFLLHQSIESKKTKLARRFISEAGALDYRDGRGAWPLHLAVEAEALDIVRMLLGRDEVDIDGTDRDGATALMYAARNGNVQLTRALLDAGAKSGIRVETSGESVLHAASRHKSLSTLKALLEYGEDPNALDLKGRTPMIVAAETGNRRAMALLVEHGADPNIRGNDGQTMLHQTLWKVLDRITGSRSDLSIEDIPDAQLLELLLEHGADANLADPEGWTPLHRTASSLDALPIESDNLGVIGDIAQMLIERGADPNRSGPEGAPRYQLAHAARAGGLDQVKRIYEADPSKLDSLNREGKSAFQMAIEERRRDVAGFLLDQGADLAVWKHSDGSPLDYCVDRGDTQLVALLLEHGIPSAKPGVHRGGPLHVAARKGDAEIIDLLLKHGYDANLQEARGNTALHLAARKGCETCVENLLAGGADPTTWNAKGDTPLALAKKEGHKKVRTLLKQATRSTQMVLRPEVKSRKAVTTPPRAGE